MSRSSSSLFRAEFRGKDGEPSGVPAGPRETGDDPRAEDVIGDRDNGDRFCRLLGYSGREITTCKNCVYIQPHQLRREFGKLLKPSLGVTEVDGDVVAINET
jgi:hypothetical protein